MHFSAGRANRLDEFLVTVPARSAPVFKLCEVVDGGTVVAASGVDIKALLNEKGAGAVDGLEVIRDLYSCCCPKAAYQDVWGVSQPAGSITLAALPLQGPPV